jgi:hypothetical protein
MTIILGKYSGVRPLKSVLEAEAKEKAKAKGEKRESAALACPRSLKGGQPAF